MVTLNLSNEEARQVLALLKGQCTKFALATAQDKLEAALENPWEPEDDPIKFLERILKREREQHAELQARMHVIHDAVTNHTVKYFKGKVS